MTRGVGASPVAANELALLAGRGGSEVERAVPTAPKSNEGGSRRYGCLGEVAAVTW
jgi:hypothetical protein